MTRYLQTTQYSAMVDVDGTVRVYDDTAGHYTLCHSLTPAQEQYIRARAKVDESQRVITRNEGLVAAFR